MVWFNDLKVQKRFGLVFVLYKWFGSVRFGFKAKKPNRARCYESQSKTVKYIHCLLGASCNIMADNNKGLSSSQHHW